MHIVIAVEEHVQHAQIICDTIAASAQVRGTGIAKRTPAYIISKIRSGNAVIALDGTQFAGFCYIESWGHGKFVANSGLIVHPEYRNQGLAKKIKKVIFEHSKVTYPNAKIFGITTGLAVMKINYELGYRPVTFSELTDDPTFWKGCQTCKNYDVLTRTERSMCLCTGMLYEPETDASTVVNNKEKVTKKLNTKAFNRLKQIKQQLFLKKKT